MIPATAQLASQDTLFVLAAFFAAILLVDAFDISLPRGDSIGMSGPLVAASVVVFGLPAALLAGLASAAIIQLARRFTHHDSALTEEIAVRLVATLFAGLLDALLAVLGASALDIVVVPAAYLSAELIGRQTVLALGGGRLLKRLLSGNISRQALLFAAQLSVSALTILTVGSLGFWTVIPVVALLLLMRQAYSMLLEIRETYLTTVGVLVEAAESQSPDMAGHSDRTASVARAIGSKCGLSSGESSRLSYAALLHDLGRIADAGQDEASSSSASMVADIDFFSHVRSVLNLMDGDLNPEDAEEADLLAGFIVSLASSIDVASHPGASFGFLEAPASALSAALSARSKAQVVAAAVALGYPLPAIA